MALKFLLHTVLLLLCLTGTAYSQVVTNIKHYSTADGLSDNRVTFITKDSEGFMWFASWAGITRFDGNNFLTFKSYPGDKASLKSNRIDEIVEDADHRHLWLKAYDKQVYRFDKLTQQFMSLSDLLQDESIGKISFSKILSVRDHQVWLKTEDEGVVHLFNLANPKPSHTVFSWAAVAPYKLPSKSQNFFHLDQYANVWLGTNEGVCILKPGKNGQYTVQRPKGLLRASYTCISGGKTKIWLSNVKGMVVSVEPFSLQAKSHHTGVTGLHHILAAKHTEAAYFTTASGDLMAIYPNGQLNRLFATANRSPLFHITEDSAGVLWVESQSYGMVRFSPETKLPEYLFSRQNYVLHPTQQNNKIFQDRAGVVWINMNGTMFFYSTEKKMVRLIALETVNGQRKFNNNISRTFYDPSGVLWLGNGFDGVEKLMFPEYGFKQCTPQPTSESRAANEVRGILADRKNRLWIGTKAGELFVFENGKRIAEPLLNKPINKVGIYSIIEDKAGKIWMGTKANGIIKASPAEDKYLVSQYFAGKSAEHDLISNSIYCVLQDRKGRLWAGSYDEGLILITEKDSKTTFKTRLNCFRNYPKEGFLKIRHLAEDAAGRIWIGTTAGLLIFDPDSSAPEHYTFNQFKKVPDDIHSLGGNDIQFIFRDSRAQMWVLTTTGGLNLAQGKDPLRKLSFINFSSKDGLPSDFLLSCTEDRQRNLWIATQNGLSKFYIDKRKFQNFNYHDGLQEGSFSEGSSAQFKNGEMVFGNNSGYLVFDPAKIKVRKINAPMVFTNLQINSRDINPGVDAPLKTAINNVQKIELLHDQNVVSIDFTVLDFRSPDKQNYAYRLVGFDNVWRNSAHQRRATYTKLPPGNYTFEVKALNDELYEKIPFKSLQITILPPFWRTWWAYTIYIIIGIIAFVMARRVAITMLKLRQGIEIERRLVELKLNFFTQISHELRTPLTLIVNPSEEVLQHEKLSGKGKAYMQTVVKNSHRMLRMVNQVLDLRKVLSGKASLQLSKIEIISLVKNAIGYFREAIAEKKLRIELISDRSELFTTADPEKLEIVIYNLLANAIKFSPAGNSVYINLSRNVATEATLIEVADQGPGVRQDELQEIFKLYYEGKQVLAKQVKGTGIGLALSKELIELHGGKISAMHNDPCGLRLLIELPADQAQISADERQTAATYMTFEQPAAVLDNGDLPVPAAALTAGNAPVVLLVEDNAELRAFLADKFNDFYYVETACDGEDGFEKAQKILPDLIVSDIMMPKMDGIQLLDRLKTTPHTSHIPVVLLTAKYSVASQIESLKYGADYYITKPFQMDLLQAAISSIIFQRKKLFKAIINKDDYELSRSEVPSITKNDREFLEKIVQIVESKLQDTGFNIDDVAASIGMSRTPFYKKFKSLTHIAPVEFVREVRLKKAKELFDGGEDNVSVVAYAVGFNNPKYFSTCFKAQYQVTPSDYLKSIESLEK